jgi:hypothetical protein
MDQGRLLNNIEFQKAVDHDEVPIFLCTIFSGASADVRFPSFRKIVLHTHSHRSILFVGTEISPQFHFTLYDCEVWAIYQAAAALLLLAAVDYILLLRGMAFSK